MFLEVKIHIEFIFLVGILILPLIVVFDLIIWDQQAMLTILKLNAYVRILVALVSFIERLIRK